MAVAQKRALKRKVNYNSKRCVSCLGSAARSFFMPRVGSPILMKQNFRRLLIFSLLFIVYLGAIRLAHEVCGPEEDGNLLVNGVAALILATGTYLI